MKLDPVAWMTHESSMRLKDGGNCKGAVPVHQQRSHASSIPLYAIPPGYVVVPVEEKGWLVEWSGMVAGKVVGPIAWLCLRPKRNGFGALGFDTTQDSAEALRLCRKEDAEAVLKLHLGGGPKPDWYTEPYSVTEHIWSDKAMIAAKEQS